MVFSWDATGDVSYNFHSAPDGAPPGYSESFDARESSHEGHGTYTAPFSGIHGWYWENLGADEVTLRLTTAGFYRSAQVAGIASAAHARSGTRGATPFPRPAPVIRDLASGGGLRSVQFSKSLVGAFLASNGTTASSLHALDMAFQRTYRHVIRNGPVHERRQELAVMTLTLRS